MSSVTVQVVLIVVLLISQVPAMASFRRLPEDSVPSRTAVLVFMVVTTLAVTALVASVAVSVVDP